MAYPATPTNFTNPAGTDQVATVDHAALHSSVNDEIEAITSDLVGTGASTGAKGPYASSVANRFEIMAYKGQSCRFATVSALPAVTYANGTSGVGATLTATANGVMAAIDGVTPVAGDRMVVKNQAAPAQNGIYVVTSIGAAGAPFVLTRHYDSDTSAKLADCKVLIDTGTVNGDTEWYQASTAPTIGTTSIYFRRSQPIYGHGNPRSLWTPGYSWPSGTQSVMETVPRIMVTGGLAITAVQTLVGGIVAPAGRPINNINLVHTTAGATYTAKHYAIIRQSDRVILAHTANSTTVPTANAVYTQALTAAYTPIEDTPVWVLLSYAATTLPQIACSIAGNTALNGLAPAMCSTNGTATSATALTDGGTVTAPSATGLGNIFYIWLT